jgi:uncharacterized membrane protein
MYHPFSVAETLKAAWDVFKKNFATIAVFSAIGFTIILVSAFLVYFVFLGYVLKTIGFFILLVEISFIFLGFIKLIFTLIDKQYYDFEFKDIVPGFKMLSSYLILLITVSTLTVFATTMLEQIESGIAQQSLGIISGIIVQFFFIFYFPICTCYIVDDESGPFESVAQSFRLIKGYFLKYLVLFLFIEALIFVSSLTIVGIVIVLPFVNIILVVTYRKLVYSHLDVDDDIAETN